MKQIQIKIIYFYSKYGVVKHEDWNKVKITFLDIDMLSK